MGLHINKNRDNLKDEVIEINEQSDIPNIDFGFYYYDLQQKKLISQNHLDALM